MIHDISEVALIKIGY